MYQLHNSTRDNKINKNASFFFSEHILHEVLIKYEIAKVVIRVSRTLKNYQDRIFGDSTLYLRLKVTI